MPKTDHKSKGSVELKNHLKNGVFSPLYIFSGEETYLKEYYLNQLKQQLVDESFREFNLTELDAKALTPQELNDAIESCPMMSDKKLVIIYDFDLCKAPAAFETVLDGIFESLPPYICLVFYYDIVEFKPDKRTKIYSKIEKNACVAEFSHLPDHELIPWIKRRLKALHCQIENETCEYMVFLCGNSMTRLVSEIEKAAANCTTGVLTKYNIDAVCTRALDAVVFDLTDAVANGQFDRSIALVHDLILQKNNEVMLFTAITRHIERMYTAKLCELNRAGESQIMELLGSKSSYFIRNIVFSTKKLDIAWLRNAAKICAQTDTLLKSSAADKHKIIDLALLSMSTGAGITR